MKQQNILIIDTSRPGINLAINSASKYIETEKQSLALSMAVADFLSENNIQFSDLSAIGVIVGPGSFTGIRLGIAYAKGIGIGLKIPVIPVNAFEVYMESTPDAFIAINSGRSDMFVGAHDLPPCTMDITEIETFQMKYPRTVGHVPYNMKDVILVAGRKLQSEKINAVIPMYLRPSYAEITYAAKNS